MHNVYGLLDWYVGDTLNAGLVYSLEVWIMLSRFGMNVPWMKHEENMVTCKWSNLGHEAKMEDGEHEETKWTLALDLGIRWVDFGQLVDQKINSWPKSIIGQKSIFF